MTPSPPKGAGTDPRSWPVKAATSYGGIVLRPGSGGLEVALIRPRREGKVVWALPKGAKDADEDPGAAALREVREETGLDAEVIGPLEPITYWFTWPAEQVRYRKTVHFFLMRYTAGEPTPDNFEVDEVRFFPLDEAARKASYPSERKVLQRAAELARSALGAEVPADEAHRRAEPRP